MSQLKGGPELVKFLSELPDKIQRNLMRGALRAGAKVVAEEAKLRIHPVTGLTAKSIGVSTGRRNGMITAKVRTKGPGAYKAPFLEFGTAPHWITARGAKVPTASGRAVSVRTLNRAARITADGDKERHALVINGQFVGQMIAHPGARPHPFMRPALDAKADEAVEAMGAYIRARMTKQGLNAPDFGVADEEDE